MFLLGAWRAEEPTDEQVQESVDRLKTALRTSFRIEDRRDALKKLAYVAKSYPQVSL
jgi:hypothetical protein